MPTVTLSSAFDFSSAQDWNWVVTDLTSTGFVISDGIYRQSFTASFSFDPVTQNISGTATDTSFFVNGALVYSATGMNSSVVQLQVHANTYGDTQETYGYVLQSNDTIIGSAGNDTTKGYAGDDTINGGAGIDTAVFSGNRGNYTLTKTAIGWTVNSSAEGVDTLSNTERIRFADKNVALDLDGNAGKAAKILGAVFGEASVSNPQYAGIGLSLLDGGMSYADLMQLALTAAGATTHTAVMNLLWTNLFHSTPTTADVSPYIAMLANGSISAGALGEIAADLSINAANINLVGLQQTGLVYS
jgi:hypothetical protein